MIDKANDLPRALPLIAPPRADELLSSWLTRIAQDYYIPPRGLLTHMGLSSPSVERSSSRPRLRWTSPSPATRQRRPARHSVTEGAGKAALAADFRAGSAAGARVRPVEPLRGSLPARLRALAPPAAMRGGGPSGTIPFRRISDMRHFHSNPAQTRDHYQELIDKIIVALEAGGRRGADHGIRSLLQDEGWRT